MMNIEQSRLKWRHTDDSILKRYALQPDFTPFDGQQFAWRVWFVYPTWRWDKEPSPYWSRRHIMTIGSNRTICGEVCDIDRKWSSRDWKHQPADSGPVDECPECRGMAEWYANKAAAAAPRDEKRG